MPELAVIMPVKDGAKFLKRSIGSTLRSLPKDSELFIFDDGSTDSTREVVYRMMAVDRRIRIASSDTSLGVARALNILLGRSDSRYVARMDVDDQVLPFRFYSQIQALRRGTADVTFCSVLLANESGRIIRPELPGRYGPDAVKLLLLLGNFLVHPAMMARRQTMEAIGGYREVPAEDYDLWLRLASSGATLQRTAIPYLKYTRHPGQLSWSDDWGRSKRQSAFDEDCRAAYDRLALSTLGVDAPPAAWFLFAMHQGVSASEIAEVKDLIGMVRHHSRKLSAFERASVILRVRQISHGADWAGK